MKTLAKDKPELFLNKVMIPIKVCLVWILPLVLFIIAQPKSLYESLSLMFLLFALFLGVIFYAAVIFLEKKVFENIKANSGKTVFILMLTVVGLCFDGVMLLVSGYSESIGSLSLFASLLTMLLIGYIFLTKRAK